MFETISQEMIGPIGLHPAKSVRVLLLDDSKFDRARIRRLSNKTELAVQLDEVGSIDELGGAVLRTSYDLILIDYRLPVGDGMKALSHILDDPMNRDAGKIMITGDAAVDTAVQAMRAGCHDFLTKESMNVDILREAMLNALTVARQRLQLQLQADHQRDIIRQGLIAALNDSEIQGSVASILRQQLAVTASDRPQVPPTMDAGDIDVMLAGFTGEDEFIFH